MPLFPVLYHLLQKMPKVKSTGVVGGFRGDKSGILEAQVVILSPAVQKTHPGTSGPHQWQRRE